MIFLNRINVKPSHSWLKWITTCTSQRLLHSFGFQSSTSLDFPVLGQKTFCRAILKSSPSKEIPSSIYLQKHFIRWHNSAFPADAKEFQTSLDDADFLPSKMSWLFIPTSKRSEYCSVLESYLDFDASFSDVDALTESLKHRGLEKKFPKNKLSSMKKEWIEFSEIAERKETYKKNVKVFQSKLKKLQNLSKSSDNTCPSISKEIQEMKSSLASNKRKLKESSLIEFEDSLVPALLELPNQLHPTTPIVQDEELMCYNSVPDFKLSRYTHSQLGLTTNTISFSDDVAGAFYLHGELAELELALDEYFVCQFQDNGFTQHSNPDLVKGVTAEGCGYDIHDSNKALKIIYNKSEDEDHAPLFLFGGCSFPSFTTYFAKRVVGKPSKFLPQKLFASGRLYRPLDSNSLSDSKEPSIFNSMQSTAVSAFVAFSKNTTSEAEITKELLGLLVSAYKDLNLHFRVSKKCARNLEQQETAAYSIEMITTTPGSTESHLPRYIEIGRISLIGDYASQRLLMLHTANKSEESARASLDFLNVVYVKAMDISKFVAVFVENMQTDEDGLHAIPKVIKDIMSKYE